MGSNDLIASALSKGIFYRTTNNSPLCNGNDQPKIVKYLEENGFHNYKCMDSRTEAELMGDYYASMDLFPGLAASDAPGNIHGYMAKFHKDRELTGKYTVPSWIQPLQVGTVDRLRIRHTGKIMLM